VIIDSYNTFLDLIAGKIINSLDLKLFSSILSLISILALKTDV